MTDLRKPKLAKKLPNDKVRTLFFNILIRFRLLYRSCGSVFLNISALAGILLKSGNVYFFSEQFFGRSE